MNLRAGGGRANRYLPQIQRLFKSYQVLAQFIETESAEELESRARKASFEGHSGLFAMGGDGTFQALANAAFGSQVLLGILPMGGGNDFARALGLPDDPVRATEIVLRGKARQVDLVSAKTGEGRSRLYAGGGGIGLDALAAKYASGRFRRLPGRSRYIASALRALAGFVPVDVTVELPDKEYASRETKALLAAVLNTPTYGAGLKLAPEAKLNDGLLHVVLLENIGVFDVMRLLPSLVATGELRTSHVQRWQSNRVRLKTRTPVEFHGDGEVLGTTPVELELVSRAVEVLAPGLV